MKPTPAQCLAYATDELTRRLSREPTDAERADFLACMLADVLPGVGAGYLRLPPAQPPRPGKPPAPSVA